MNQNKINGERFVPNISSEMFKQVSPLRREILEEETNRGLFRDGSAGKRDQGTWLGNVVSGGSLGKSAQMLDSSTIGGSAIKGSANGNTVMQNGEVYSPLWLQSNMSIPRDRAGINAWCRSFYALNPIVQNAINLHSTYPLGKMEIRCHNKEVENIINEMAEEIDLMDICVQMAQEYWLLGETFVMGELDERTAKWSRFVIQNPDYMVVKRSVIPGEPNIYMKPDDNLKRICFSNTPSDIAQRRAIDDTIISYVKRGQNIPLDNYYTSHLSRKISPYETHGTPLILSIFRALQLFDQIYESKFAQAEEMINPWRIFKVGGGTADFRAAPVDLEAWRATVEQAAANKNFKIFTHDAVTIETIGAASGIYDTSGDIDRLMKFMYAGLMVPQIIIEGGGDITYANGTVSLEVLRDRYNQFRGMMTAWLRRKVFAPICKLLDKYEYVNGKRKLIVPEIEFNRMNMFDLQDYIQNMKDLTGDNKRVSVHTLYYCLGLDWDTEQARIRKEDIAEEIRKKEKESLAKMSLNELRSLGEDSEIPEVEEKPGAGGGDDAAAGGGGLPGEEPAGDLGSGSAPPSPPSS